MSVQVRLFLMMVLQLAVWGAWAPKLFPYMGMLGFAPWQQSLVGSSWGVANGTYVICCSSDGTDYYPRPWISLPESCEKLPWLR